MNVNHPILVKRSKETLITAAGVLVFTPSVRLGEREEGCLTQIFHTALNLEARKSEPRGIY